MKILAVELELPGTRAEDFEPHLKAEANAVLGSPPLVRAGLITFDVIPLVPYPGFARLVAP